MLDEIEESYAHAQDAICGLSLIAHWYLGVIIVGVRMGDVLGWVKAAINFAEFCFNVCVQIVCITTRYKIMHMW